MLDRLLSPETILFTIAAGLGTLFFLLRMGLMLLGGLGGDLDLDADVDGALDADGSSVGEDVDADGSTGSFRVLSVQSLAVFVMGFGWGGLAGIIGLDWGPGPSIGLGVGFGLAMVWLLGLIMKAVYDLRCSGNIHLSDAVGCAGRVYVSIPAGGAGRGQVRVVVNERARIYDAVSTDDPIPTGRQVRVVGLHEDGVLTVTAEAA